MADFAEYGPNKLLVIKDRYSGLVRVYAMKDLTMKSAITGYFQWAHSYGLASRNLLKLSVMLEQDTSTPLHIPRQVMVVRKEEWAK